MNVGELISKLQELDPNLRVVLPGYEGGFDDLNSFDQIKIVLNFNDRWYYGSHERLERSDDVDGGTDEIVDAIVLKHKSEQ
jgi:hypothetical protein